MKRIDCLGDLCPLPVMRLQNELDKARPGESFMLVTDHSCVTRSIQELSKAKGLVFRADEVINGVWELHLAVPESDPSQTAE